ncbi:hypothetical protein GCM10009710_31600 [Aeromicrobium alkaliterrae]|uniref:DUF998 domain-containing protein n=1 Tax=Aeromicrobium alkaliterrae TaxID=302168 RepID=A0ABN2K6E3_9ACTN
MLAAACWIVAGVVYLATEAVAAAAFDGYSYATNYISDLGIPEVGTSGGRAIDSPLAWVMNTGFIAHGVLFAAAAALFAPRVTTTLRRWFVALAVTHGIGNVLVGLVHSGTTSADTSYGFLHGVGAGMAIVGGNLTIVVVGLSLRRAPAERSLGTVCLLLGVVGLLAVTALLVDGGSSSVDVLPDGVWERISVYTITAAELLLGVVTLVGARRLSRS